MKLSDREIEMISNIPKNRRDRKLGAWLGLATALAAFVAVQYFDFHHESLGPVFAILLGFSTGEVARAHFRVRPEDKLIDLLQRYVNSDPEAVRQFSFKSESSERAV
jgi:hypothetical protein